jgi:predicted aldo/keto reductase-like oxidoreductase
VQKLYDAFPVKRSPAEWAFRFVYDKPEAVVILSGINTFEQLTENLKIFENAPTNCLSADEQKLFEDVRAAYLGLRQVGCTACRYCMPCPQGVDIPGTFTPYDTFCMSLSSKERWRQQLERLNNDGHGPDKCVECGQCEGKCPQGIKIIDRLKAVSV